MYNIITSRHNRKIQQLLRLKNRREREETSLFLIEGYREIKRAHVAKIRIESLYFAPELFLGENEKTLIAQIEGMKYQLPASLFHHISYRDRPDGLVAIAYQMKRSLGELKPKNPIPLYLIAESIEKPGNLGTILRSADGAGADGVIVCDRCTDIYNPNVVRSSVGTLFTLPVIESSTEETYRWIQKQSLSIVATTPSAALSYTEAPLTKPIAILVGTEQIGLSDFWMQKSDLQVHIPMKGIADSLNVATATTLLLYEAIRQRAYSL